MTFADGVYTVELPNGMTGNMDSLEALARGLDTLIEEGGVAPSHRRFGHYWVNAIKIMKLRPLDAAKAMFVIALERDAKATHGAWLINY